LQLFVFQAPATASVAMGRIQQLGKRRDVSRGLSRQNVVRCRSYLRVDPWSLQTAAQVAWVGTQNVLTVRDVCMVSSFFVGVLLNYKSFKRLPNDHKRWGKQETKRPGCNITVSHVTSFVSGCQLETPRKVRTTTPRSHCTEAMGGEGLEMLEETPCFSTQEESQTVKDLHGEGSIQKPQVRKPEKFECTFVSCSNHILMFQKMDIKLCDVLPLRDGNILFHLRVSLIQIPQIPRRRVYPQS